jgi:hypothetical protein
VEDIWKTPTGDVVALDKVLFKLKKVNFFLKGWGYNLSGSRNKRKKEILEALFVLEEMEVATPLDVEQIKRRIDLKTELFDIFEEEELHWFRRYHET